MISVRFVPRMAFSHGDGVILAPLLVLPLSKWQACQRAGWELWCSSNPGCIKKEHSDTTLLLAGSAQISRT